MAITYHSHLIQGSEEWLQARCGLLTASEMHLIITPTLRVADNEKSRAHVNELLAQRITGHVEAVYISDDMIRGRDDELLARGLYHANFAPVTQMGFVTNDKWGFTIGCSPDGLVGDDGAIECKGRRQKYQVATIVEDLMPDEYLIQVQTILLVTERPWCDFVSYSAGLPMLVIREEADEAVQKAIVSAATAFEECLAGKRAIYDRNAATLIRTERREDGLVLSAAGIERRATTFQPDILMAG